MAKRLSRVQAKAGQLRLKYGIDADGERDHVIAHGEGVHRGNAWLLHSMFQSWKETRDPLLLSDNPHRRQPSFLDELEQRGLDLKTLEITIRLKEPPIA